MFTKESERVRLLKESAGSEGDWYIAPPSIEEGEFMFIVACDPFGSGSMTAYDVTFSWHGWNAATFVFDISDEEAISAASSSPIDGWAGWDGSDLILAWSGREDWVIGSTRQTGAAPSVDQSYPSALNEAWARLARTIVHELNR